MITGYWSDADKRTFSASVAKKRVLVLEARGLRFEVGRALADAIPDTILGRRESRILDFRQIYDGEITHPDRGLEEAVSLPNQLRQAAAGVDRSDFRSRVRRARAGAVHLPHRPSD